MRRVEEPVHRLFSRLTSDVQLYFVDHAEEFESPVRDIDLERYKTDLLGVCRDGNNQVDPVLYHSACEYLDRSLGL